MFVNQDYQTPARRNRGIAVPPLDVKANFTSDQGMMSPLSANSHDSGMQAWGYPGHPNTPVHGFNPTDMVDIGQFDHLHINMSQGNALSWTYPETTQPNVEPSFASSLGLSAFGQLKLDSTNPQSSFAGSSYHGPLHAMPSVCMSMSEPAIQTSQPALTEHTQCVVPMQILANPLQDSSQYTSYDWTNHHNNDITQLLSPVSSTSPHEVYFKPDPYLSQSPEVKPAVFRSPPRTKTTQTTSRRVKKDKKRRKALHKGQSCAANGVLVEYSLDDKALKHFSNGGSSERILRPFPCDHPGCPKRFARSEHQKRHMKTHDPARAFPCYKPGCSAGGANTGAVNRHDNANDHAYTHLKSWLNSEGAPLLARVWGVAPKKNKARNEAVSPVFLRERILERLGDDTEKYQKCFNTFNRKASDDFEVHIDWSKDECPLKRCLYKRGQRCRICDVVRKKA